MNALALRHSRLPRLAVALMLAALIIGGWSVSARRQSLPDPLPEFPRQVVWAWERPEYLSFMDPATTGVAYWAGTIFLSGDEARFHPRMQTLVLPAEIRTMAVVRIDSTHGAPPSLAKAQQDTMVAQLEAVAHRPGIHALQIDYDAVRSEREFYRGLLAELRPRLPADVKLSITALVSWCLDDDWIAGLPVDEAVPMLFRMGPQEAVFRARLRERVEFPEPLCQLSYGTSTDEPGWRLEPHRRRYYFAPRPWQPDDLSLLSPPGKP